MNSPTSSISFGKTAKPQVIPLCRDYSLVCKGAKAPKPHFPPMEVRMLASAARGLLPAGIASIIMRAIIPPPPLSWRLCETKTGKHSSTTTAIQTRATYSSYWHRKVKETKSKQTLVFDPGGCSGRLRCCPFLSERLALLRRGFVWDATIVSEAGAFLLSEGPRHLFIRRTSDLVRRKLLQ